MKNPEPLRPQPGEALEFAVRYYHWALDQWRIEFEKNFPVLRSLTADAAAVEALHAMKRWPKEGRMDVARALVRRFHYDAARALGEPASPSDEDLVRDFFLACGTQSERLERAGKARGPQTRREPQRKVRNSLWKELVLALEPIVGNRLHRGPLGGPWEYETPVGRWTIFTHLDLGSGTDLNYEQIACGYSLGPSISPLSWLGVSARTTWNYLTLEEVPEAAANVAKVCRVFMEAAPQLLPT